MLPTKGPAGATVIDQSLVTSGFDVELLLSERYLNYALLGQVEAGFFPLTVNFDTPAEDPGDSPVDIDVTIHPPEDYERRYQPHPDVQQPDPLATSFDVELLFDHESGADLRFGTIVDVVDNVSGQSGNGSFVLFFTLDLTWDEDDRGFQRNHELEIEVVDIGGLIVAAAENEGVDVDELLAVVKETVDRTIPLGVVGDTVQAIELRQFPSQGTENPASFGIYINLALKNGPEKASFFGDRGDTADAQNFRPADEDLAFATSSDLYGMLGPNARFRMAEKKDDDSEEFHYPIRKDPSDRESDVIAKVKGISVFPEATLSGVPTGRLVIDLHGEYLDAPLEPDFHFQLFLQPVIDNGLLDWEVDTDIDLGLAGVVLSLLGGLLVGLLTWNPGVGVGAFFVLLAAKGAIAEPLIAAALADDIGDNDLSFFDVLPHRVTAATRRWDPLYETEHQIVALLTDDVQITPEGIAFAGEAVLDKEPDPRGDVVIRDEERSDTTVTHLRYRVRDFAEFEPDYEAIAPGTDRREFSRADSGGEPTLVSLTDDQIADRLVPDRPDGRVRLLAPIDLIPKRVYVRQGQIDGILCISRRERNEERNQLIDEFRSETREQIETDQGAQIRDELEDELEEELGQPPTEDQLDEAVEDHIDELVCDQQADFEEDELPALLEDAILEILRLDLAPEEYARYQERAVLFIEGKEIIYREGTPYYRDHPDWDPTDNLLALPRYQPPYEPPSVGG